MSKRSKAMNQLFGKSGLAGLLFFVTRLINRIVGLIRLGFALTNNSFTQSYHKFVGPQEFTVW